METRRVVGRKIVAIEQRRTETNVGPRYDIEAIVLDNGVRLTFSVIESDGGEYVIDGAARLPGAAVIAPTSQELPIVGTYEPTEGDLVEVWLSLKPDGTGVWDPAVIRRLPDGALEWRPTGGGSGMRIGPEPQRLDRMRPRKP